MTERPAFPFRFVAVALVALLLAVVGGGVYVYLRHVRYERVAVRHLPGDARAALRIDVERIQLFEPVRRHLLPLANRIGEKRDLPPRLTRIERETGLRLGIQLRELAVALGPGDDDWVVVLGGLFPDSDVVGGIQRVLQAEGHGLQPLGANDAFVAPRGWAMGRATDGVLVAASSAARLRAALAATDAYRRLGLVPNGAGAFTTAFGANDDLAAKGIEALRGTLTLGDKLGVDAVGRVRPGLEAPLAADLDKLRFGTTKARVLGPGRIELHMDLTSDQLDQLAELAAERVLDWAR